MTTSFSFSRLSLLALALMAFTFSSCDDDDDTFLGFDLDDDGTLFLSSNTSGNVGVLNLEADTMTISTFASAGMDADGIYYDTDGNNLYQVDRTNDVVVKYDDVINGVDEGGVDIDDRSTSNFMNGRGLDYRDGTFVVAEQVVAADSTANQFVLYNDDLEYTATYTTPVALWGIQFVGTSLYAVVDLSDSVAIYENFTDNMDGDTILPTRYLKVDGIGRTHGLEYNSDDDVMLLTDIGDAGNSTDGGLVIIRDFSTLGATVDSVGMGDYTMISGAATLLGNPVDVDYDEDTDRIYVAERANGNGQLLIFEGSATGNVAPVATMPFPGLSSLYLHRD